MLFSKAVMASVVLTTVAISQDLAPDVLLLTRIKAHLREELSQVPNYTCLETIARFHREPDHSTHDRGRLMPLDTVRLEVVYSDHREWYGSPGDRKLSVDNPVMFIGSGMIGNGAFGWALHNLLEGARFMYRGEEKIHGRTAVKYDFRLSSLLKALTISIPGGMGTVGEEGSLWFDPRSLDLVRLESRADEIPPYLPLDEASTNVNYARVRIGSHEVLLAQHADMHMVITAGIEDFDRLEFTHCRAYSAESVLRFDMDSEEQPKSVQASTFPVRAEPDRAVPALLKVTVQLTTLVSEKDTVGTLIEGKVSGDVSHKGRILIPNGSTVFGRIRRLERYQGRSGGYVVGLEFTEIDMRTGPLMFYADLLRIDKNPRIKQTRSEQIFVHSIGGSHIGNESVTLRELPGVASFFISGETFRIPTSFRMVWRTRGPIR